MTGVNLVREVQLPVPIATQPAPIDTVWEGPPLAASSSRLSGDAAAVGQVAGLDTADRRAAGVTGNLSRSSGGRFFVFAV